MSTPTPLEALAREGAGKGAARTTRREGFVPGVVYGDKKDPLLIKMEPRVLVAALKKAGFFNTQFNLSVGDDQHRVLARDVQFHPVTEAPLHIDFMRVTDRTRVAVNIPVHFLNEEDSPGLERGGVLNVVRHEVEVYCNAGDIPEEFAFDLAGLDIGDSLKISDITLPPGVVPTIADRDFTVATIAAPTVVRDEAAEEQEEAEAAEAEAAEEGEDAEGEESEGEETEGESEEKSED